MPFTKSMSIPSVKATNNTVPPNTIHYEGYLNKQNHGKCKTWLKRYFILHGEELRYYKSKDDKNTLAVISLDHYSLVPDTQPLTCLNSKQWKPNTFCLVSDDETKYNWPDYYLQASNSEERDQWVSLLESFVFQSTSVLEKWLEKIDLPNKETIMTPSTSTSTISSSVCQDETCSILSQSPSSRASSSLSLRYHKSFDSLHAKQQSYKQIISSKLWSKSSITSSSSSTIAPSAQTLSVEPQDLYTPPSHTSQKKAPEMPIIDPHVFDHHFNETTVIKSI